MAEIKRKRLRDLTDAEKQEFLKKSLYLIDGILLGFTKGITESLKHLTESIDRHSEVIAPLLQKAKLWYFPSMPEIIQENLLNLVNQGGDISIEQIEQAFIGYYDDNNCINLREMVVSWFDSPIFFKRKDIIEDALEAHISGKFTISIPSLLPQIEGILSSITGKTAGHPGPLLKYAVELGYLDGASSLNALADDIILALVTDPFLFKGGVGDFFTPEKFTEWIKTQGIETIPLNRHAILHGVQIDYATQANSLRVFFLLDSVYWIAYENKIA